MGISAKLVDAFGSAVNLVKYWNGHAAPKTGEIAISVIDPIAAHGVFRSISFAGAGTTALVTPTDNGSLVIADLVITGDKVNAGTIEVRWTDGTNTSLIIKPVVTDAPVYLHIPLRAPVRGWRDARIDVIVTNAVIGSVMVTYVKAPEGIPYAEWDALR